MQRKPLGCFSRIGLVVSLLFVAAVVGLTLLEGGGLFSPGPLTAQSPRGTPLGGYRSHAEFESRCSLCHQPFAGIDAARCTTCHTDVREQIADASGTHGQLAQVERCTTCHTDHQGRDATITIGGLEGFDHNAVFPLDGAHARLTCAACHPNERYQDTPRECAGCHQDPHEGANGTDCARCHDTFSWTVSQFDHAGLTDCASCHAQNAPPNHYPGQCSQCHTGTTSWDQVRFDHAGLTDCQDCHAAPPDHFSGSCNVCHTDTTDWRVVRFSHPGFSIYHGGANGNCALCHLGDDYTRYDCSRCHDEEGGEDD
jgi:hypothetical protein